MADLPGVIVPSTALADVRSKSDRYVPPDSNATTHRSNSDRPMTSVDRTPTGTYRFGCAAMMACGTRKLPSRRAEEFASHNRPTQVSECLSDDVAFRGEGAGENAPVGWVGEGVQEMGRSRARWRAEQDSG
jgi:hypothetical protein